MTETTKPRCARCGRSLKRPIEISGAMYGSTCARAITGIKARRARKVKADERTADLFAEVQV